MQVHNITSTFKYNIISKAKAFLQSVRILGTCKNEFTIFGLFAPVKCLNKKTINNLRSNYFTEKKSSTGKGYSPKHSSDAF